MASSAFRRGSDETTQSSSVSQVSPYTASRLPQYSSSPDQASKPQIASPPSESLPYRLTRKRAASLATSVPETDGEPAASSAALAGPRSGDSAGSVCLCPPDPKIPRPRNAFMLYRQHHQATVVAQNPGLANPEISKIIGRQWKEETQDVKDSWDGLAQEEKTRHQRQYPNYKYQPRRKGKKPASLAFNNPSQRDLRSGSLNGSPSPEDWCNKCGRRSLTTPTTPMTPFTSGPPRTLPPLTPSTTISSSSRGPITVSPDRSGRVLPPMATTVDQGGAGGMIRRRPATPYGQMRPLHLSSVRDHQLAMDEDCLTPLTPDAKRRRFNELVGAPHGRPGPVGLGIAMPRGRSGTLPRPSELIGGRMEPPPRPGVPQLPPHRRPTHHEQETGLRLPPLQTATSSGPRTEPSSAVRARAQEQARRSRSVEAMVMTIPYLSKIKVLSRISPPLASPSPTSPALRIRGAIVAVDGEDVESVKIVSEWLRDTLARTGENAVKVFGTATDEPADAAEEVSDFESYLGTIRDWHQQSRKIKAWVTTPPPPSAQVTAAGLPSASPIVTAITSPLQAHSPSTTTPTTTTPSPILSPHTTHHPSVLPVALLPSYQLTRSNLAASRIPINDGYAPVDHWQWMATMWRGIVGPDLTVWIRRGEATGSEDRASGVVSGAGNGSGTANGNGGGVEVHEEGRVVVVRMERGAVLEGRIQRRLGFEVGELVRGFGRGVE
ncbi:MAG: hypothetical protein M1817_002623 [Caeruleum heppii]|nr:MAG: hypothetical protein M1817_002623 [Caeruleum heppii]